MAKRQTTYLILEEYLQSSYFTLPQVESRIEEHLNGHKFELGDPFTVELIPVKGSAFYLIEAGSRVDDDAGAKIKAAETFKDELRGG